MTLELLQPLINVLPFPLRSKRKLIARAAGSLLGRHSYPSVCAMVFPHVVGDMLSQADSFSADAQVSEAIERGA